MSCGFTADIPLATCLLISLRASTSYLTGCLPSPCILPSPGRKPGGMHKLAAYLPRMPILVNTDGMKKPGLLDPGLLAAAARNLP